MSLCVHELKSIFYYMKRIEWDEKKNHQLQAQRDLSFEMIEVALQQSKLIDVTDNLSSNHLGQQVLIVDIDGYLVVVPFVEDEEKLFLKTAFKSRKATKDYKR